MQNLFRLPYCLLFSSSSVLVAMLLLSGCINPEPIGAYTDGSSDGLDSEGETDTTGGETDTTGGETDTTDTTGSETTDTTGGETTDTDTDTDTDTGMSENVFGSCEMSDPTVYAAFSTLFLDDWDGTEGIEMAEFYHLIAVSDSCSVSSVVVSGEDVITNLACTRGSIEVRVAAPTTGEAAWSSGDLVEFELVDRVQNYSVYSDFERYVSLRRDGNLMFAAVQAHAQADNTVPRLHGELFSPISVAYERVCGGLEFPEAGGVLYLVDPNDHETTIYHQNRGTLTVGEAGTFEFDVERAAGGPCCHVVDSFLYTARAITP